MLISPRELESLFKEFTNKMYQCHPSANSQSACHVLEDLAQFDLIGFLKL